MIEPAGGSPPAATGADRVRAALSLRRADRIPVSFWCHSYPNEWDPQSLADVTVADARRYDLDFVKLQVRATCFGEAFGAHFAPAGTATDKPLVGPYPVHEDADWRTVARRVVDWAPLDEQVEAIRLVAAALGPDVPILQTVFSAPTLCAYLAGKSFPAVLRGLATEPRAMQDVFARAADVLVELVRRSVDSGASGVYYAIFWDAASANVTDRAWYRDVLQPWDEFVLSRLPPGAWFNVLHLCGPRVHFDLSNQLPTQATSWSVHDAGNPSLADGRAASGKAVMGGVERAGALFDGRVEDVRQQVSAAVSNTGGDGLLLAPGCSVPPRTSTTGLRTLTAPSART